MMQELITAANTAGLFKSKVFGRRALGEWALALVVNVEREDDRNLVTAEFLDSRDNETIRFTCRSDEPVLEIGDFVNVKGDEISFIHKDILLAVTFRDGETIITPKPTVEPTLPPPPLRLIPKVARLPINFPERKRAARYSREPMTEAEMIHFNSDTIGLGLLFARLEPVIKTYAREQTRKPVDVSARLNTDGYKTANGAAWTPRLVHFLLALMFNTPNSHGTAGLSPDSPQPAVVKPRREVETKVSMDDKEGLARLLSRLGRVSVKR